jgi:hypothetical protein
MYRRKLTPWYLDLQRRPPPPWPRSQAVPRTGGRDIHRQMERTRERERESKRRKWYRENTQLRETQQFFAHFHANEIYGYIFSNIEKSTLI